MKELPFPERFLFSFWLFSSKCSNPGGSFSDEKRANCGLMRGIDDGKRRDKVLDRNRNMMTLQDREKNRVVTDFFIDL